MDGSSHMCCTHYIKYKSTDVGDRQLSFSFIIRDFTDIFIQVITEVE